MPKVNHGDDWLEMSPEDITRLKMTPGILVQQCACKTHLRAFCRIHTGKHINRTTSDLYQESQRLADQIYDEGGFLTADIEGMPLYQVVEWMENLLDFNSNPPCDRAEPPAVNN